MSNATSSFNTTVRQMMEMSQRKKLWWFDKHHVEMDLAWFKYQIPWI